MPKPVEVRSEDRLFGDVEAGLHDRGELRRGRGAAELLLGFHALPASKKTTPRMPDLVDDRELELEVLVGLEVAADVGAVR